MTSSPRRAAFIASIVSALGASGSKGSAFSIAIRIIIMRKASETVSPMDASTASASFLIARQSARERQNLQPWCSLLSELHCSSIWRKVMQTHRYYPATVAKAPLRHFSTAMKIGSPCTGWVRKEDLAGGSPLSNRKSGSEKRSWFPVWPARRRSGIPGRWRPTGSPSLRTGPARRRPSAGPTLTSSSRRLT